MLIQSKILTGFKLNGLDGEIGSVKDFYFDDRHWTIRYLVVETGGWLFGRKVLISPYALMEVNRDGKNISVDLSKKQIEDSPSWNSDKPVSRQFEENYYGYYGWPMYWTGPYMWGTYPTLSHNRESWKEPGEAPNAWDAHLRSTQAVIGQHIQAKDGDIGHVVDFILDERTWAIRYFVVDTRNWWPGRKVLVSPRWIETVNWIDSTVFVRLSRKAIIRSPEYSEEVLPDADYETKLHRHYHRPGYWIEEAAFHEVIL